jgi:hypothetical protein
MLWPQSIDLLNVAFENPRSLANAAKNKPQDASKVNMYDTPDRMTGLASAKILAELRPHRHWNFVRIDVPYQVFLQRRDRLIQLMQPNNTIMDLVS